MKRIADILVDELIKHGLEQVFQVTSGGAMYFDDAFLRCRDRPLIYCNYHEQACVIAARGHARLICKPAIVDVTPGRAASTL